MEEDKKSSGNGRIALIVLAVIATGVVLKFLSFLFMPVAMSVFLAALMVPFFNQMRKLKIPHPIAVILVLVIIGGVIRAGVYVGTWSEKEYSKKKDEIHQLAEQKLLPITDGIKDFTGIDFGRDFDWSMLTDRVSSDELVQSVSPVFNMFNSLVGFYLMTVIYLLIMLAGIYRYNDFLIKVGGKDFKLMVNEWIEDLKVYIKVKTIVSLLTGVLFGITCYAFGVDFAITFGTLAFVLNFIPQLGSLIATVFPVLLGFVEIDSIPMAIGFAGILVGIQFLMGSVVEVKYIGQSFAINTIIVFVNLIFWGYMWGVAGIILSVPIIVFIKNWSHHYKPQSFVAKLLK